MTWSVFFLWGNFILLFYLWVSQTPVRLPRVAYTTCMLFFFFARNLHDENFLFLILQGFVFTIVILVLGQRTLQSHMLYFTKKIWLIFTQTVGELVMEDGRLRALENWQVVLWKLEQNWYEKKFRNIITFSWSSCLRNLSPSFVLVPLLSKCREKKRFHRTTTF